MKKFYKADKGKKGEKGRLKGMRVQSNKFGHKRHSGKMDGISNRDG